MGVPVRILVGGELSRSHLGASSGKSCHTGSPPCSLTMSLRWLLPVDTDIIEGLEASGSGCVSGRSRMPGVCSSSYWSDWTACAGTTVLTALRRQR
jgi:hypothetical protein